MSRYDRGKIQQNETGQYFFICTMCQLELVTMDSFVNHQIKKHGTKLFEISDAPQDSKTKSSDGINKKDVPSKFDRTNRRHTNNESSEPVVKLQQQPKELRRYLHPEQHSELHEEQIQEPPRKLTRKLDSESCEKSPRESERELRNSVGKYDCKICFGQFDTLVDLDSHTGSCQEKDQVNCDYCPKPFKSIGTLRSHIRKNHQSELPYVCNYCPKGFNRREELDSHQQWQHDFTTSYKCEFCDTRLYTKYEQDNHVRRWHQFPPYQRRQGRLYCSRKSMLKRQEKFKHDRGSYAR